MLPLASQQLSDDHQAVGDILEQLLTSLNNTDAEATYSRLDLLWARLAVHIRAEHLHLFPTVLSRLTESTDDPAVPGLSEAQSIVENLRADHDFFMRELARAIGVLRELPKEIDGANDKAKLTAVENTVREIEKRLVTHNEVEEKKIYRWASTLLIESEQSELIKRINAELENRPPRFPVEVWANQ
jgi:hemerythrin superfamily protein